MAAPRRTWTQHYGYDVDRCSLLAMKDLDATVFQQILWGIMKGGQQSDSCAHEFQQMAGYMTFNSCIGSMFFTHTNVEVVQLLHTTNMIKASMRTAGAMTTLQKPSHLKHQAPL